MIDKELAEWRTIHCRVGSSETVNSLRDRRIGIHCRVGSSERPEPTGAVELDIHCRVGSSEMDKIDLARRA